MKTILMSLLIAAALTGTVLADQAQAKCKNCCKCTTCECTVCTCCACTTCTCAK